MVKKEKVVKLEDILESIREVRGKPIDEILNKKVILRDVEFNETNFGEGAILISDEGEFRTTSKVLIQQLKEIKAWMTENDVDGVEIVVKKKKRYYTLW